MSNLTPRERIWNVLNGKPVDRIPIYTQIPFAITEVGFKPASFDGYGDYDNWREEDPEYRKLVIRMEKECDNFYIWQPACMNAESFFIPKSKVKSLSPVKKDDKIVLTKILKIGTRELKSVKTVKPGAGYTWENEHFCKTPEDAKLLLEADWEPNEIDASGFYKNKKLLGEKGVIWVTVPSPILVVCRLFDPTDFLLFVRTEEQLITDLMSATTSRIKTNLIKLLNEGVGPIIRFGGAEHATPPMLSPNDFNNLVEKYDNELIKICKASGLKVAVHCHGRIRHALNKFMEMGVDQTDPVETYPDGDLSLKEAKEIAKGKITLTGNIQMRELYAEKPEYIKERVKQIIKEAGPDHLILTTTGTPLEKISTKLADNYHCLIDTVLKYGVIK